MESSRQMSKTSYSTSVMKLLMDIEKDASGPQRNPKPLPKDYMKENVKRLKEIQEKSKQKKDSQPLRPLKPSTQYSKVQPKYNQIKMPVLVKKPLDKYAPSSTVKSLNILPSPRSVSESPQSGRHPSSVTVTLPKIASPNATEDLTEDERSESKKDFSRCPSSTMYLGRQKTASKVDVPHPLGRVPAYLLERKRLWEEEEKRRLQSLVDASIPPGHTLLSDDERQETLLLLEKNYDELIQRLASLPVRNDTIRLQKFKEELEKQLAKVEEGIKIFSRPKVLIKNDV